MLSTGEVIQLALAPVFLLVAVGTLINAVTARLARVIDRSRSLAEQIAREPDLQARQFMRREMRSLGRRMRFANLAINSLTGAAVVVCVVVMVLFVDGLIAASLEMLVVALFLLALALITFGLISFLGEVTVATATLRVNPAFVDCIERRDGEDAARRDTA